MISFARCTSDDKTTEIRDHQDETLSHHKNIIDNLRRLNSTIGIIINVRDVTFGLKLKTRRFSLMLSQFVIQ